MLSTECFATQTWLVEGSLLGHLDTSETSWLAGGNGRYSPQAPGLQSELDLGYRARLPSGFFVNGHLQAQAANRQNTAKRLGLIELNAGWRKDFSWNHQLAVKLGQFFLPTSMENIDPFWESPYTLSFSSLNSWIGEEFRPIGLDLQYRYFETADQHLEAALSVFGGNDSMGALLAYRGWAVGRHRSVYGDRIALPSLETLSDTGRFGAQRDDGTKPFGQDLDGKPGIALRISHGSGPLEMQATWVDNRGDGKLHRGEYAWRTRFAILGLAWQISETFEWISEASRGNTRMGGGPAVNTDFYSAYTMLSWWPETIRYSLRYDVFGNQDRDFEQQSGTTFAQDNADLGRRVSLAAMWQASTIPVNIGVELDYLNGKRRRVLEQGLFDERDAWAVTAQFEYHFEKSLL